MKDLTKIFVLMGIIVILGGCFVYADPVSRFLLQKLNQVAMVWQAGIGK